MDKREEYDKRWEEAGFGIPAGKLSIHAEESIRFSEEVLQAGTWQLKVLKEGYKPQFKEDPPQYREKNNRSAEKDMETVREKVKEWEEAGFITKLEEQAWCTNPLSVVTKVEAETGKVKKRVVLDSSRHLNNYIVKQTVHLEDLKATGAMIEKGDYMCIFDLENQFFHVTLHEQARKYFGFSIQGEDGEEAFYSFNILPLSVERGLI